MKTAGTRRLSRKWTGAGVDAHKVVHVVWPTLVRGSAVGEAPLALFHATTRDGQHFSTRQQIPARGTPRHPQMIARPDGSLVITWDEEIAGGRRRVAAAAAADQGGALRFTPMPIETAIRSEYPVVAPVRNGAVLAWTSGSAPQSVIHVERVP